MGWQQLYHQREVFTLKISLLEKAPSRIRWSLPSVPHGWKTSFTFSITWHKPISIWVLTRTDRKDSAGRDIWTATSLQWPKRRTWKLEKPLYSTDKDLTSGFAASFCRELTASNSVMNPLEMRSFLSFFIFGSKVQVFGWTLNPAVFPSLRGVRVADFALSLAHLGTLVGHWRSCRLTNEGRRHSMRWWWGSEPPLAG